VVYPPHAPGLLLLPCFNLNLILEFSFSQGYLPCSQVFKARLGCLGISLVFCLDVVVILVSPFNSFDEGPLAFGQGGVHFFQGKVQFVDSDRLLFYGDDLGPDQGLFGVGPGSSWSVCTVNRRFSSTSASMSPSGCGPDRFVAAFSQRSSFFQR
jgi:hypothetical protein